MIEARIAIFSRGGRASGCGQWLERKAPGLASTARPGPGTAGQPLGRRISGPIARFGLGYLETFLRALGGRMVVMEDPATDDPQELVDDLIAITPSFSEPSGQRAGQNGQ